MAEVTREEIQDALAVARESVHDSTLWDRELDAFRILAAAYREAIEALRLAMSWESTISEADRRYIESIITKSQEEGKGNG